MTLPTSSMHSSGQAWHLSSQVNAPTASEQTPLASEQSGSGLVADVGMHLPASS